jgi:threonine/homoserine/homoserine lactone efflux protein
MISFVLASILIELTPGPNMTWLAVLGATKGRTAALAAVAGICLGLTIAGLVAGLGLSALLLQVPELFTALRWAGTLYLFYLAWDAWRDAAEVQDATSQTTRQAFVQGLVSNVLNPKAYLFYAAILPPFIDPQKEVLEQILFLSLTYVAIATIIHAGIAVLAGAIARWLSTSSKAVILRKALALLIAAAAVWFFFSTKVAA